MEPIAILDQKLVKCGNSLATKVLAQWSNSFLEDAIWEFWFDLKQQFPEFNPWGQGFSEGEVFVTLVLLIGFFFFCNKASMIGT